MMTNGLTLLPGTGEASNAGDIMPPRYQYCHSEA